jgi:hypothetical protein
MNNKFDKILTQKIEESFQELHVPYEAEHWNNLRSTINSSGNSPLLWPKILKVAAGLLIGIALGLYYVSLPNNEPELSTFQEIPPKKEQIPPRVTSDDVQNTTKGETETSDQTLASSKESVGDYAIREKSQEESTKTIISPETKEVDLKQNPSISLFEIAVQPISIFNDSSIIITESHLQDNSDEINSITVQKSDLRTLKPEVSILANTNFGFSKAEDGVPVGFAAGVSSSFSLSRKLSMNSGIIVAHQNLNIKETGSSLTLESAVGAVQEITQANLLTLDIPVNFQYHFRELNKIDSFISVGISSILYLEQIFTTTNRQLVEEVTESEDGSIIITKNISEQKTKSSKPAFSGFDPASLLNVSLGFQRPLSSQSEIIIEPFLKYPLSSLTTQNAKFGYGGIQVKVVF